MGAKPISEDAQDQIPCLRPDSSSWGPVGRKIEIFLSFAQKRALLRGRAEMEGGETAREPAHFPVTHVPYPRARGPAQFSLQPS
jgi:hypothetical protein